MNILNIFDFSREERGWRAINLEGKKSRKINPRGRGAQNRWLEETRRWQSIILNSSAMMPFHEAVSLHHRGEERRVAYRVEDEGG